MKKAHVLNRVGPAFYAIATVSAAGGIVLNILRGPGVGNYLMGLALVLGLATALELGHLKKW